MREVEAQAVRRHQAAALRHMLAERPAQRLVQQVRRRVVGPDRAPPPVVDLELRRRAKNQLALLDPAEVNEEPRLLPHVGDRQLRPVGPERAAVADLAARLGVEGRLVHHHLHLDPDRRGLDRVAADHQCQDLPLGRLGVVAEELGRRRRFSARSNQIASSAASPEPTQAARAFAFCSAIAASKPATSTARRFSRSASWVRSSGKP